MAEKRIKVCCALLAVTIFFGVFSLSVGESYARYENKVSFRTILVPEKEGTISSDVLTEKTEASVFALAGDFSETERAKTLTFSLVSDGKTETSTLGWSVEHAQYIDVSVSTGNENINSGTAVSVGKDETKTFTMVLKATDAAFANAHEALESDITFTWGNLSGAFTVGIPEVKAVQPEDSEQSEEDSEVSGSQNVELNSPGEQEADPGSGNPEEETKETENGIMSISSFDPRQLLPVKTTLKEDVTDVIFGLGESGYDMPRDFPKGTMFSLDGGKSFYMLYDAGTAKIDAEDINGPILFDFGRTDMNFSASESITIVMQPRTKGVAKESYEVTVLTNAADSFKTEKFLAEGEIEMMSTDETETLAENESGENAGDWESFILSGENSVELFFPPGWTEAELTCTFQILTLNANGAPVYVDTGEITSVYTKNDEKHSLLIKTGENLPAAGTYRIYMIWKYKGADFYKTDTAFFINYSTPSSSTLKS